MLRYSLPWYSNQKGFKIFRVLDKVVLRHNICQRTYRHIASNRKSKSISKGDVRNLQLLALHLCKGALHKIIVVELRFHRIVERSHFLEIVSMIGPGDDQMESTHLYQRVNHLTKILLYTVAPFVPFPPS